MKADASFNFCLFSLFLFFSTVSANHTTPVSKPVKNVPFGLSIEDLPVLIMEARGSNHR